MELSTRNVHDHFGVIMLYYSFEYWPCDNGGNDSKFWRLIEMPRDWAEYEVNQVIEIGYYDNWDLKWYLVEVEAETCTDAFDKAWTLVLDHIGEIDFTNGTGCFSLGYVVDYDEDGLEIDWELSEVKKTDNYLDVHEDRHGYRVNVHLHYPFPAFTLASYKILQYFESEQYEKTLCSKRN